MDDPLSRLPEAYAKYFVLRRAGVPIDEIAAELQVPLEAMDAFVELAHSKIGRPLEK